MHAKAPMPPAGEAILAGDIETMRRLAEDGSLLFRKGKAVELRKNIPETLVLGKRTVTRYTDAFRFAYQNDQMEIVRLLIDRGLVDLGPKGDALFMAIARRDFALLDYMLDHGGRFGREGRDITSLLLNLSEVWDEAACPALLAKADLPIRELGGPALCHAAGDGCLAVVRYLLDTGVDINSRGDSQSTPVLRAAKEGRTAMVQFLVERGADLTIHNKFGYRPYTAARANGHMKTARYIQSVEPAVTEEQQDERFKRYRVSDAMRDYFKNGPLLLAFPEGTDPRWIRLFAYTDVPELDCQGHACLALVEDSEDYAVMLLWEPETQKIWFADMEHDIFQAVAAWPDFIRDPGSYVSRAVRWEFD